MGTMKEFRAKRALEIGELYPYDSDVNGEVPTISYKTTDGTSFTVMKNWNSAAKDALYTASFRNLRPVATADLLENYSFDDYQAQGVGTTTYSTSRVISSNGGTLSYAVTVSNNTGSDITVGCVKFIKNVRNSNPALTALFYGYYPDNPVTIANGNTATITVVFKVGE